ncbi:uncharacterized protein LOC122643732 [Telopea speciosissima]|uniref:uncharacterized protein LOC122643732 n=1 Tax=Telopea speciosissima TaxID=54955 RepID=UPI001CC6B72F|nr:uncharacterized protein LOC122643732 [Telopea speciosissima]
MARQDTLGQKDTSSVDPIPTNVVPAVTTLQPALEKMSIVGEFDKIEQFDGQNFKRWRQMLLFALTQIGVAFALTDPKPPQSEILEEDVKRIAWIQADFQCKNRILNALAIDLYNVYNSYEYAYMIWNALCNKYTLDDEGSKKYVVANFLNFEMTDDESVSSQIDKFQILVGRLSKKNVILPDVFVTSSLLEKLPPSWTDFKNNMKHKRKEWSFEQVVIRIKIEERNRNKDNGGKPLGYTKLKANLVESNKQGHFKKVFKSRKARVSRGQK